MIVDILRELQFMLANERLLIELYISVKNNKTGNIDLGPKMLWREEKIRTGLERLKNSLLILPARTGFCPSFQSSLA